MKQCSAQEAYLKKQSMRKFQVRFLRVFLLLVFLGLWQCAAPCHDGTYDNEAPRISVG